MKVEWEYSKLWSIIYKYRCMIRIDSSILKEFYDEIKDAWNNHTVDLVDFDEQFIKQIIDYKTGALSSLQQEIDECKSQIIANNVKMNNEIYQIKQKHAIEIENLTKSNNEKMDCLLALLVKSTMKLENLSQNELFKILVKQEDLLLEKRLNELID